MTVSKPVSAGTPAGSDSITTLKRRYYAISEKYNQKTDGKAIMEIAKKLKTTRAKLGYSQSQAAQAWKINRRTLQEWEQGRRRPRGLALAQLETILERAAKKGEIGRRSRAR